LILHMLPLFGISYFRFCHCFRSLVAFISWLLGNLYSSSYSLVTSALSLVIDLVISLIIKWIIDSGSWFSRRFW
jgi:hypothetical protein